MDLLFKIFESNVLKLGYDDVKAAIFSEVPEILDVSFIDEYFDSSIDMLTVWEDLPQLYILISGMRR